MGSASDLALEVLLRCLATVRRETGLVQRVVIGADE
jgi:hypothetical protein